MQSIDCYIYGNLWFRQPAWFLSKLSCFFLYDFEDVKQYNVNFAHKNIVRIYILNCTYCIFEIKFYGCQIDR